MAKAKVKTKSVKTKKAKTIKKAKRAKSVKSVKKLTKPATSFVLPKKASVKKTKSVKRVKRVKKPTKVLARGVLAQTSGAKVQSQGIKTLLNLKVGKEDRKLMTARAKTYTDGNLSLWLRRAGTEYVPPKQTIKPAKKEVSFI